MSIPKSQTTEDPQFKAGFIAGFCARATEYALQQARGQFLSPAEKADATALFNLPLREIAERVFATRGMEPGVKRFEALLAERKVG